MYGATDDACVVPLLWRSSSSSHTLRELLLKIFDFVPRDALRKEWNNLGVYGENAHDHWRQAVTAVRGLSDLALTQCAFEEERQALLGVFETFLDHEDFATILESIFSLPARRVSSPMAADERASAQATLQRKLVERTWRLLFFCVPLVTPLLKHIGYKSNHGEGSRAGGQGKGWGGAFALASGRCGGGELAVCRAAIVQLSFFHVQLSARDGPGVLLLAITW